MVSVHAVSTDAHQQPPWQWAQQTQPIPVRQQWPMPPSHQGPPYHPVQPMQQSHPPYYQPLQSVPQHLSPPQHNQENVPRNNVTPEEWALFFALGEDDQNEYILARLRETARRQVLAEMNQQVGPPRQGDLTTQPVPASIDQADALQSYRSAGTQTMITTIDGLVRAVVPHEATPTIPNPNPPRALGDDE